MYYCNVWRCYWSVIRGICYCGEARISTTENVNVKLNDDIQYPVRSYIPLLSKQCPWRMKFIIPLTLINLLALTLMYWICVVRLFSCVNLLSQIVHCIYHNVHFVWIVGENEICFVFSNFVTGSEYNMTRLELRNPMHFAT